MNQLIKLYNKHNYKFKKDLKLINNHFNKIYLTYVNIN